jgi:hypothetical protein
MGWALFIINHLRVFLALIFGLSGSTVRASGRDGLEGSFASFGLCINFLWLANA